MLTVLIRDFQKIGYTKYTTKYWGIASGNRIPISRWTNTNLGKNVIKIFIIGVSRNFDCGYLEIT